MKITGAVSLAAAPQQVWAAMHDPAVLARCLPGCESLTETAPDRYAMRVTAGVAAIKGTYEGTVELANPQQPESFTLKAAGAGAPGTVEADVVVRLAPTPSGGTELTYDADASVGGAVGGVGQRMLSSVTKKMAGQFFRAVDADIAGVRPREAPATTGGTAGAPAGGEAATAGEAATPSPVGLGAPSTFAGSAAARPGFSLDYAGFAAGVAFGGLLALVGVAVGARIARRS